MYSLEKQPKDFLTRLAWDLFNSQFSAKWIDENLYPYLNDTHITTALVKITQNILKNQRISLEKQKTYIPRGLCAGTGKQSMYEDIWLCPACNGTGGN